MRKVIGCQQGQATVELTALLPLLVLVVLTLWQVVIFGEAAWMSGSAARSAARAQALGQDVKSAARAMLPGRLANEVQVKPSDKDGSVQVFVSVPTVFGKGHIATVHSKARFEEQ